MLPGYDLVVTDETRIDDGRSRRPGRAKASEPTGETEKMVARGRSSGTPFVLLGGVALVIWSFVALVAIALLLLWWLG
jgi:hypothetical protein